MRLMVPCMTMTSMVNCGTRLLTHLISYIQTLNEFGKFQVTLLLVQVVPDKGGKETALAS